MAQAPVLAVRQHRSVEGHRLVQRLHMQAAMAKAERFEWTRCGPVRSAMRMRQRRDCMQQRIHVRRAMRSAGQCVRQHFGHLRPGSAAWNVRGLVCIVLTDACHRSLKHFGRDRRDGRGGGERLIGSWMSRGRSAVEQLRGL